MASLMMSSSHSSDCFRFNFALVSRIAKSFATSSSFDMKMGHAINIEQARKEHEDLVEGLRRIGLDVIELPSDDKHPDGLFVDDIAVVIHGTALICNPPTLKGRPSRQGELAVVRQVLRKELGLKIIEVDTEKALIEGGDVLWTGREIFVGLSNRSNMLGAQAVAKAFPEYPTTIVKVYPPATHLKDYITMAGPEIMTVGKSEGAQKTFLEIKNSGATGYKYISVDEDSKRHLCEPNTHASWTRTDPSRIRSLHEQDRLRSCGCASLRTSEARCEARELRPPDQQSETPKEDSDNCAVMRDFTFGHEEIQM